MEEKGKVANDESFRDGANLERKLQKHEAFEAELKANADRCQALNQVTLPASPLSCSSHC